LQECVVAPFFALAIPVLGEHILQERIGPGLKTKITLPDEQDTRSFLEACVQFTLHAEFVSLRRTPAKFGPGARRWWLGPRAVRIRPWAPCLVAPFPLVALTRLTAGPLGPPAHYTGPMARRRMAAGAECPRMQGPSPAVTILLRVATLRYSPAGNCSA